MGISHERSMLPLLLVLLASSAWATNSNSNRDSHCISKAIARVIVRIMLVPDCSVPSLELRTSLLSCRGLSLGAAFACEMATPQ